MSGKFSYFDVMMYLLPGAFLVGEGILARYRPSPTSTMRS